MITEIESNVKGTIKQSFYSKYVAFIGRNGSGKSSYVHSLELALFSKAFDASNKDVKQKKRLDMLAKGRTVFANVRDAETTHHLGTDTQYLNAVQMAQDAMSGGTLALARFICKYMKYAERPDLDIVVDHPHWREIVDKVGVHDALLKLEPVVNKSLRHYREKLKETEIATKYITHEPDKLALAVIMLDAKERIEACKRAADDVKKGLISTALYVVDECLTKSMERWIPDGMGKPIFHFDGTNLVLGFKGRPVPSGAETVCLAVALAAVLLPWDKSIFIYPDRAYDSVTLGDIMRVARTLPVAGVFIQCISEPVNYDAESLGWQMIQTS